MKKRCCPDNVLTTDHIVYAFAFLAFIIAISLVVKLIYSSGRQRGCQDAVIVARKLNIGGLYCSSIEED